MHGADLAGKIRPAVVAGGEGGNRVHPRVEQRLLVAFFIKRGTDAGNVFGGVEIEVDLTEAEAVHGEG